MLVFEVRGAAASCFASFARRNPPQELTKAGNQETSYANSQRGVLILMFYKEKTIYLKPIYKSFRRPSDTEHWAPNNVTRVKTEIRQQDPNWISNETDI